LLLDGARLDRSAVALIDGDRGTTWTYGQLEREVNAMADALAATPRGVVAWVSRSVGESVAAYLGALQSGHVVLPLPTSASEEMLVRIFAEYKPDLVLTLPSDRLPAALTDLYSQEGPSAGSFAGQPPLILRRTAEVPGRLHPDLCLLLSTSGSTGSPKMVRLTRANVLANAKGIVEALDIDRAECTPTTLPLSYSFGLSILHSHLLAGATVVLTERSVLEPEFWDAVRRHGCTSLAGVPSTYSMVRRISFEREAPASLQTLTQAGGKMHDELIEHFERAMNARGGKFYVMYGQTEATARITVLPPHLLPTKRGGVGFPLRDVSIEISAATPASDGPDGAGEIVCRGPNVMLGYADRRADLERGDDLKGTLRTGDLGYLDDDGCLFVTGRLKRIAKVFGLRISLDEIEARLATWGPVAVAGSDDRISVFAVEENVDEVRAAVASLAEGARLHPSAFRVWALPALPLLPNGKVDYARLRKHTGAV
jgi:acyl-CoA synthetase (AMP-forming)/AMP-acid ligase II